MAIQAQIPAACAALHNFIMDHDPNDVEDLLAAHGEPDIPGTSNWEQFGTLAEQQVTHHEKQ